jgi:hypothetical protein
MRAGGAGRPSLQHQSAPVPREGQRTIPNNVTNPSNDAVTKASGPTGQQNVMNASAVPPRTYYYPTTFFLDHIQRLAMMVALPPPMPSTAPPPPPNAQSSGPSSAKTQVPSNGPISLGPITYDGPVKSGPPRITFQLYLDSNAPAFGSEQNLRNVDHWCRLLLGSTAFHYLKNQLKTQNGPCSTSPGVQVETYEAVHGYEVREI